MTRLELLRRIVDRPLRMSGYPVVLRPPRVIYAEPSTKVRLRPTSVDRVVRFQQRAGR